MDDNIFKVVSAAVAAFFSYCVYAVKRGINRQDKLEHDMVDHEVKITMFDGQIKNMLDKIEEVLNLGKRIEESNKTILRALARKTKTK